MRSLLCAAAMSQGFCGPGRPLLLMAPTQVPLLLKVPMAGRGHGTSQREGQVKIQSVSIGSKTSYVYSDLLPVMKVP